jgi:hypothetical protein
MTLIGFIAGYEFGDSDTASDLLSDSIDCQHSYIHGALDAWGKMNSGKDKWAGICSVDVFVEQTINDRNAMVERLYVMNGWKDEK